MEQKTSHEAVETLIALNISLQESSFLISPVMASDLFKIIVPSVENVQKVENSFVIFISDLEHN